jgi:hypothetical protein
MEKRAVDFVSVAYWRVKRVGFPFCIRDTWHLQTRLLSCSTTMQRDSVIELHAYRYFCVDSRLLYFTVAHDRLISLCLTTELYCLGTRRTYIHCKYKIMSKYGIRGINLDMMELKWCLELEVGLSKLGMTACEKSLILCRRKNLWKMRQSSITRELRQIHQSYNHDKLKSD